MKSKYNHNKRIKTSQNNSLEYVLKARLNDARQRSKRHNLYFELNYEDLLTLWNKQNGLCALSGIPMTHDIYNGRVPTNISIDKIDPSKGYIKNNIQLVCSSVNMMKGTLTVEQLLQFCYAIINTQKNKNKYDSTR